MSSSENRIEDDRSHGAWHPLYGVAGKVANDRINRESRIPRSRVTIGSIRNLHQLMAGRSDEHIFKLDRSCSFPGSNRWVEVGHELHGNGFTLRLRNQHGTPTDGQAPKVQVDSPSSKNEMDKSLLQEIDNYDSSHHNVFHIELESSCEMNPSTYSINMELTFSTEVDDNASYLVLQQEKGSTEWHNITDQCKTTNNCKNIEIPVKKPSRIWVFRLKKGFHSLKHAILELIYRQVLFHLLVYYRLNEKRRNVDVRIIGISDELYQNPSQRRTAETTAKEEKFVKGKECVAKQVLKKGTLNLGLYKSSKYVDVGIFDMGRNTIYKSAEWYDFSIYPEDLDDSLEVELKDGDKTHWRVNLNKILNDVVSDIPDGCKQPTVQITKPIVQIKKPEMDSFDNEICEHDIPWLARHLNRDVEKCAMLLMVDSGEIERIKQQSEAVESRNIGILVCWRKLALSHGCKPTWENIIDVITNEDVRRFDVIRALLGEEEISDEVLLWLARRAAPFFETYARALDVPDYEVDMVCRRSDLREEMSMSMLKRWRERFRKPTIEDLIEALEGDIVQQKELAREMRATFC